VTAIWRIERVASCDSIVRWLVVILDKFGLLRRTTTATSACGLGRLLSLLSLGLLDLGGLLSLLGLLTCYMAIIDRSSVSRLFRNARRRANKKRTSVFGARSLGSASTATDYGLALSDSMVAGIADATGVLGVLVALVGAVLRTRGEAGLGRASTLLLSLVIVLTVRALSNGLLLIGRIK
jgi:hypothetical protein